MSVTFAMLLPALEGIAALLHVTTEDMLVAYFKDCPKWQLVPRVQPGTGNQLVDMRRELEAERAVSQQLRADLGSVMAASYARQQRIEVMEQEDRLLRGLIGLLRTTPVDDARFMAEVLSEVQRARAKFPDPSCSMAAFSEEAGELAKAMLDEPKDRVRKEAVQCAVMAMRVALEGDPSMDAYRAVHVPRAEAKRKGITAPALDWPSTDGPTITGPVDAKAETALIAKPTTSPCG